MNKISNEERESVFHAYHKAQVECKPYGETLRTEIGSIKGVQDGLVNVKIPKWQSITSIQYDKCQLLLRNLSSITDEDAIEVARIIVPLMFVNTKKGWIVSRYITVTGYLYVKIHHHKKVWSVQIDVQLVNFDVDGMEERCTRENDMKPVAVIDFLRSKGYNIGYGSYSPQDLVNNNTVKG